MLFYFSTLDRDKLDCLHRRQSNSRLSSDHYVEGFVFSLETEANGVGIPFSPFWIGLFPWENPSLDPFTLWRSLPFETIS